MYQHEISIITEKESKSFPLIAVMNLEKVKTLHLNKGEVVRFARPESPEATYIATTNKLNIEEAVELIPRNWIPQRKWKLKNQALWQLQDTSSENRNYSQDLWKTQEVTKVTMEETPQTARKDMTLTFQMSTRESSEESENSLPEGVAKRFNIHSIPGTVPSEEVNL